MTPEQFSTILAALTALIVAVSGLIAVGIKGIQEMHRTNHLVNGKMSEMILMAQMAGRRQGELEGRDYMRETMEEKSDVRRGSTGTTSSDR